MEEVEAVKERYWEGGTKRMKGGGGVKGRKKDENPIAYMRKIPFKLFLRLILKQKKKDHWNV